LRKEQPSLEAQLCNLADEIAYNAHDIDDGVRSGLITLDQLRMFRCLTTTGRVWRRPSIQHLVGRALALVHGAAPGLV
jgi:dGTPase